MRGVGVARASKRLFRVAEMGLRARPRHPRRVRSPRRSRSRACEPARAASPTRPRSRVRVARPFECRTVRQRVQGFVELGKGGPRGRGCFAGCACAGRGRVGAGGQLRDLAWHCDGVELGDDLGRACARVRRPRRSSRSSSWSRGAGGVEIVVQLEERGAPLLGRGARLVRWRRAGRRAGARGSRRPALPRPRAGARAGRCGRRPRGRAGGVSRSRRLAGSSCRKRANSPCGSTTQLGEVGEREPEQLLDRRLQLARTAREHLRDLAVGVEPLEDRFGRARLPGAHPHDPGRPVAAGRRR